MFKVFWLGGRLSETLRCLYVNSRAYVRVGSSLSDWFPSRVVLRQECVMSPWLFNAYMDGDVREVNARMFVFGG